MKRGLQAVLAAMLIACLRLGAAHAGGCGDGVCDDTEKAHPGACPQDCGGDTGGYCGDGICQQIERTSGHCPQDCGADTTPPTAVGNVGASGVVRVGVAFNAHLLTEIQDKDITPSGVRAVRPDAVSLNGRFYVGYTQVKPAQAFGMLTLDQDLNLLDSRQIIPSSLFMTDLRVAAAPSENYLWCPSETVIKKTPQNPDVTEANFANWARFSVNSGLPVLKRRSSTPAATRLGGPAPGSGGEIMDDPTPFFHNGKYYLGTRTQGAPVLPFYVFDAALNKVDEFHLDLGGALDPGMAMAVYSLLEIQGKVWLIGGVDNNLPADHPDMGIGIAYLVAIPLSDDLKSYLSPRVVLSQTQDYQEYVAGARYSQGKLFIAHNILSRTMGGATQARLKMFDVAQNFKLLDEALIDNAVYQGDDHVTLEIAQGRIHVFYPTPQNTLRVKVFQVPGLDTTPPAVSITASDLSDRMLIPLEIIR